MKANEEVKPAINIATGSLQWREGGGLQAFVGSDTPQECAVSGAPTSKDH